MGRAADDLRVRVHRPSAGRAAVSFPVSFSYVRPGSPSHSRPCHRRSQTATTHGEHRPTDLESVLGAAHSTQGRANRTQMDGPAETTSRGRGRVPPRPAGAARSNPRSSSLSFGLRPEHDVDLVNRMVGMVSAVRDQPEQRGRSRVDHEHWVGNYAREPRRPPCRASSGHVLASAVVRRPIRPDARPVLYLSGVARTGRRPRSV